jgi:hypothetical protein
MSQVSPQWEAFANWLLMDDASKARLNLPKNKVEYSIANKVSDRTIRRWQIDPMFVALLDKKRAAQGKRGLTAVSVEGVHAILAEEDEDSQTVDSPDDEYQQIKSALVKGALTGDPKYLDLYFKTYGKEFVAEEVAARTSDLAGLALDDLIIETATVVGEDALVDYLRSQGFIIIQPSSDGIRSGTTQEETNVLEQ